MEKKRRLDKRSRSYGVHMCHCNQGENENTCKYGELDICPALDGTEWDNEIELINVPLCCTFTVVQNGQRIITKNQEIINDKLNQLLENIRKNHAKI